MSYDVESIFAAASTSTMLNDPHVSRMWELMNDTSLFSMAPEKLEKMRLECVRSSLDFFRRRSSLYRRMMDDIGIVPQKAGIQDLARLAVPSDVLRGDGHRDLLIEDHEPGGRFLSSSGTSKREPVKVYRSPLDLAMMVLGNTAVLGYVTDNQFKHGQGIGMFMGPEQLSGKLTFVVIVESALERKGMEIVWGMDMDGEGTGTVWNKMVPNRNKMARFFKSDQSPKMFFTAPIGLHLLSQRFSSQKSAVRFLSKIKIGAPPIDLGKGGFVTTGGGMKDFTDLPELNEIIRASKGFFVSKDAQGNVRETPFVDGLGMTETATIMMDRFGVMDKVPHPLSQVFLMDPRTFEVIEEDGKEGLLGIFNPFVTSWMECVYPGDIVTAHRSDRYYGREYVFVRRMGASKAVGSTRACGGELEEHIERNVMV
ncbi:MAG TPA: hypothetical protein VGK23_04080 [Methanomassiliicoccales archaeon]|jgi:phenylacetate-CoA ligase